MSNLQLNHFESSGGRPVDLANCADEPIHIPSSIQPHGLLICISNDFRVIQVSDNVQAFLGYGQAELVGNHISLLLDVEQLLILSTYLEFGQLKTLVPLSLVLQTKLPNLLETTCFAHRYSTHLILEFEPEALDQAEPQVSLSATLSSSIAILQSENEMVNCLQAAAECIKEITAYDRVMIYRFDQEWHGEVVAEAREPDLEALLGLHYPSSDIPIQARELYKRNLLRMIVDVDYNSIALVPTINPQTMSSLDMSDCALRSVSPIHVEYLRNMGVQATMTISLMVNGELWGLVACHHYRPKYLPLWRRSACELFGQLLALRILGFLDAEKYKAELNSTVMLEEFLNYKLNDSSDISEPFQKHAESLIPVFDCCGVALLLGDKLDFVGMVPGEGYVVNLADMLDSKNEVVTASHHLEDLLTDNAPPDFAGMLAMRISHSKRQWIFCFRQEQSQLVNWAGDPRKAVGISNDGLRLHPRGSFALWIEEVKGTSKPWSQSELISAKFLRERFMNLKQESLERDRQQEQLLIEHKEALLASLTHDLKGPIAGSIQLLEFMQSARLGSTCEEMAEPFSLLIRAQKRLHERLMSFLVSHKYNAAVSGVAAEKIPLKELLHSAVALSQMSSIVEGIIISVNVPGDLTVFGECDPLSRVFENLLSNAIKFSPPTSSIKVMAEVENSSVTVVVQDEGAGIPQEEIANLFARFWQGQRGRHTPMGSGLGLYTCKQIIAAHSGTIWCESEVGVGTKFFVRLPLGEGVTL